MCCGKGAQCTGSGFGFTDGQIRALVEPVVAEAFVGPPKPLERYTDAEIMTMRREMREAMAYMDDVWPCVEDVLHRHGSTEEFFACDYDGRLS